jgi:E3 ubiquitin-protein ligase HECTD2
LSLLVRKEDDAVKQAEIKDEALQFSASLLVCCLDVIFDMLTGAREDPIAPQGARYLLLLLATPWIHRPLTPLSTEYSRWHDTQQGQNKHDLCGRYEEEARILLLQQSSGKKTPSSLRDRILALCIGRIANLPETIQQVFPRWFANMPVNAYVEITRSIQEANTKTIRNIPLLPEAKTDQVKQLHDRRFLSQMIGAANIDHFSEDNENLPRYSKKKGAWKLRTSCHTLQLLIVANDIRNDATARHSAQSGQTRATDDTYQPFPIDYFYTPLLDPEAGRFDLQLDFELWDARRGKFTICQYPFLLTLGTKARILEYDNERRKKDAVRQEWHASKGMSADPYFHLPVRRENIIDDSFKAIRQAVGSMSNVTSKKLRVHFDGEEAVDAGGPQKEWFLVLTQKLFSEKLGT